MADESAIEFPCEFPIKMMGRATVEFRNTVQRLVEFHAGTVDVKRVKESLSSNATFVSITITITATSQQQLDDIYRAASAHDDVLMAL
jgi:putative lipoic acid-binding regulatory protein